LVERIPAIEPPSEPPGALETVEPPGPRESFTDEKRAQEAAQPQPWWRKVFGG
jgi:hypothetical protein